MVGKVRWGEADAEAELPRCRNSAPGDCDGRWLGECAERLERGVFDRLDEVIAGIILFGESMALFRLASVALIICGLVGLKISA